jgi:hypothetical protein
MLTGPAILEPMERIERSSVAYHATALPLSYIGWSQGGIRNPGLRVTNAALFRLSYSGAKENWSECGESNSVERTGDPMPNQ